MKKGGKIQPEDVVKIMKENNHNISLNDAQIILNFMRKFAILAINQAFEK